MDFTFGIPTVGNNSAMIHKIIASIKKQGIPNYEILIVGGDRDLYQGIERVRQIHFDESIKEKWITRKKNIIGENARYENLVIFHDYYELLDGWYEGFLKFGADWDVCSNTCLDIDNDRYYDWVAWDHPTIPRYTFIDDYSAEMTRYLYIPGHYFVVKREMLRNVPFNEELVWGESEDIEWTYRMRLALFKYKFNPHSRVKHLKPYRGYEHKKKTAPKVALVLTGLLREYQTAYQSLKHHIIDRWNPDLFISTWDEIGFWTPGNGLNERGFEEVGKVSAQELKDFYKTDHVVLEDFSLLERQFITKSENFEEFFIPEINHSNCLARKKNTISMYYKLKSGLDLLQSTGNRYDMIIRTRPDMHIEQFFNPEPGAFYVLHHRNHIGTGIGDNLQVGPHDSMYKYSRVYERMEELFGLANKIFCPHVFAQTILETEKIPYNEVRIPHKLMHTPAGEYFTVDKASGEWTHVNKANYDKIEGRFKG